MALSITDKKAIRDLHSKLSKSYANRDFRIFGSKVIGTDVSDSDIDIMILLEDTSPVIESEIDDLIFEINLKYDCLISAVYFSRYEIEDGPYGESPIYKKAMVEGKVGIPRSFKEKTENFLEVSRLLRDINKRMAIDLVVMTCTQWERFIEMDSGFSREVQEKGVLLI